MGSSNIFKTLELIYYSLGDNKSKSIFENRLLYSLTKDEKYIMDIVANTFEINSIKDNSTIKIIDFLDKNIKKDLIIWGAGVIGQRVLKFLSHNGYNVKCFCDMNTSKQQTGCCSLPVIPPEELIVNYPNCNLLISTDLFFKEIYTQLIELGFPLDNIYTINNPPQYFDNSIVKPEENEVFIDAGCYNCGSAREFIKWCNGNYDEIFAFEPDSKSFAVCQESLSKQIIDRITLISAGLWSKKETLNFNTLDNGASRVSDLGSFAIDVITLDEVLVGKKPTFIKMDIEGAELEALKGSKDIIRKYRPKLAICVYHKLEDILTIPSYLLELNPDYKLYLRHYSRYHGETVLYAI